MSNHVRVIVATPELTRVGDFKGKTYGWQNAAIFNGGDFPLPFSVHVEKGKEYAKGEFTIDPRSYQLDDKGNLRLKGIKLLPISGSGK